MPGQRSIRVGIAGLGFGLNVHLPGFLGLPGVEVSGLLGCHPLHAEEVAARIGLPVSTDLETWLDASFDAVSLALPPHELERVANAAIDRGVPILAEKPLGCDVRVARSLAARVAARPNAVDFEFAELLTFAGLREAIHSDMIGRVRHVTIVWLMESRAHRSGSWSWKTDAARHGGALTLLGTHVFHLLEWLLDPVERLSARLDSQATRRIVPSSEAVPADDLAHVLVEHHGGTVSSIVIGNANPGVAIHRWTVVGERGTAILDNPTYGLTDFTLRVFGVDGQAIQQMSEPPTKGDGRIPAFRRLASRFVDAVRSGGQCHPDFAAGARVATLVDATHRAAKAEMWIEPEETAVSA